MAIYFPAFFIPFICIALSRKAVLKKLLLVICFIFVFTSGDDLYNYVTLRSANKTYSYDDSSFLERKVIIESYNTFTISYCLSFGNDFAKNRYGEPLRAIYPSIFTYNIWNKQFYHFGKNVSFEEIASGGPVIIRGTHLKDDYGKNLIFGKELASFPEGDVVYELLGEKSESHKTSVIFMLPVAAYLPRERHGESVPYLLKVRRQ
jgi:hypothetical protein